MQAAWAQAGYEGPPKKWVLEYADGLGHNIAARVRTLVQATSTTVAPTMVVVRSILDGRGPSNATIQDGQLMGRILAGYICKRFNRFIDR